MNHQTSEKHAEEVTCQYSLVKQNSVAVKTIAALFPIVNGRLTRHHIVKDTLASDFQKIIKIHKPAAMDSKTRSITAGLNRKLRSKNAIRLTRYFY